MLQSHSLDELHLYSVTNSRFGEDVNTLNRSGWRWAEGGLLNSSSLLLGDRAILMCIEENERNIDAAFTSPPNLLAAITDSSFISTRQGNYRDD